MRSRDFCYWLQGYFEVSRMSTLDNEQIGTIKRHLAMVFKHEIDPSFGQDVESLREIHGSNREGEPQIMC